MLSIKLIPCRTKDKTYKVVIAFSNNSTFSKPLQPVQSYLHNTTAFTTPELNEHKQTNTQHKQSFDIERKNRILNRTITQTIVRFSVTKTELASVNRAVGLV